MMVTFDMIDSYDYAFDFDHDSFCIIDITSLDLDIFNELFL